jgi:hypothetical protein
MITEYSLNDFNKDIALVLMERERIYIQYVAKSIGACIKNPYIINQNHILSKNYCEVISG